jgi:hypothetical protein
MRFASRRVNTYLAMLCLTAVASAAALLIIRIGTTAATSFTYSVQDAQYTHLEDALLKR